MNDAINRPGRRLLLALLIAGVLTASSTNCSPRGSEPEPAKPVSPASTPAASVSSGLPRLVDLGSDRCIPCKKMAPILAEIRNEYHGALSVEFIDVWKDPSAGKAYGIRLIPTQIFFDGSGREVARHEGFLGKEDILATFSRSGIMVQKPPSRQP